MLSNKLIEPDKNKYPVSWAFYELNKLIIDELEEALNRKELRKWKNREDYYMLMVILKRCRMIKNPLCDNNATSSINKYIYAL